MENYIFLSPYQHDVKTSVILPMKKYSLLLVLLLLFFAATPLLAASEDPVLVKVKVYRRTEALVQLSPNPTYNGALEIKSSGKDPVHFYVFDVEGTMVYHTLLLPGARRSVSDLKKGTYSYDIFLLDESVEQGQIEVLDPKKSPKAKTGK